MTDVEDLSDTSALEWAKLIVLTVVALWALSVVTEDRFVPALNVISEYFKIPDSVAGATLMAAGASSPELFSSLIALFITHSALGVGTVVGSEIFNQLMISAGSIFYAKDYTIVIDRPAFIREVGFYFLSVVVFVVAILDQEPADDDETGALHLYINVWNGASMVFVYLLYILTCANFPAIINFFGVKPHESNYEQLVESKKGAIDVEESTPFMHSVTKRKSEDGSLFKKEKSKSTNLSSRFGLAASIRNSLPQSIRQLIFAEVRPSDIHNLEEMEIEEESLTCFLWVQSRFYTVSKSSVNAWQLRWFTFSDDEFTSYPDKSSWESKEKTYPPVTGIFVDEEKCLMKIELAGGKKLIINAPNSSILTAVEEKCLKIISSTKTVPVDEMSMEEEEEVESLIAWPEGGSLLSQLVHVIFFPMKFALHLTIPDVRVSPASKPLPIGTAFFASFMSVTWFTVLSYVMVSSLETIGEILLIPASIMGVTVSAVGTSYPNLVASQTSAKQGFGNKALGNAFGSNTFNILIGLGLPWLIYCLSTGEKYHALLEEGIAMDVFILFFAIIAYLVLVIASKFVLYKWHAYLFIFAYAGYLFFACLPVILDNIHN